MWKLRKNIDVTNDLHDLRLPPAGVLRIRILIAPVFLADVEARYGRTHFATKILFMPGYAFIGDVEKQSEKMSPELLWGQGGGIDRL